MLHDSPIPSSRRGPEHRSVSGEGERPDAGKLPVAGRPAGPTRKSATPKKPVHPDKSATSVSGKSIKRGDEFGLEGTNKAVATPKPDNAPPEALGLQPHVEKSPYTRG